MAAETHPGRSAAVTMGKAALQLIVTFLVMAALLFWPAGTLDWSLGWWLLAVFAVLVIVAVVYMWRINPELFEAREGFKAGTKSWDLVVASLLLAAIAAILPVAGFDYRFQWLAVPGWVVALGYLLFVAGFAGAFWAEAVNRHFEMGVRIQTDRDHKVIATGPYAIVRHPGYLSAIVLCVGIALALGSVVALVPVALTIVILAYRTGREDETLAAELDGYADYRRRVRYRWIPGVW